MSLKRNALWAVFALFVFIAVYFHSGEPLFLSQSSLPLGKPILWLIFIGFTVYTYYCSMRENLFKTIGIMSNLHWGKQIGIDLYLGLFITAFSDWDWLLKSFDTQRNIALTSVGELLTQKISAIFSKMKCQKFRPIRRRSR